MSRLMFSLQNYLTEELVENTSAVFAVIFLEGRIVAVENERGWDIPGGHLEKGETPTQALAREMKEEAGVLIKAPLLFAVLHDPISSKSMLFFACNSFEQGPFIPSADALAVDILDIDELLRRYHGDRGLLIRIIEAAQKRLKEADQ